MIALPGNRRRLVAAAAALFAATVVAAGLVVIVTSSRGDVQPTRPGRTGAAAASHPPSARAASGPGQVAAVSPETTIPEDTPVQQYYDQGFQQGFASPGNQALLAHLQALDLPRPAVAGGWPALPVADTPGAWVREFVPGLLDIDFAHQSRDALGAWLTAEEAPDLMPGIPPGNRYGELYATLLEPAVTGQASPIPTATQWQADAAAGVRWTVTSLQVQLDPQWQSMIDAGWQPRDLRAAVEDVSGMLTQTGGIGGGDVHRFSLVLQVGSAHWHEGYGSVLLSGWKES